MLFSISEGKVNPWNISALEKYQEGLIEKLEQHDDIVVSGDGRHDSMGHSAKYCAYTVFCCTVPFIIHFAIVQVYLELRKCSNVILYSSDYLPNNFPVILIIINAIHL